MKFAGRHLVSSLCGSDGSHCAEYVSAGAIWIGNTAHYVSRVDSLKGRTECSRHVIDETDAGTGEEVSRTRARCTGRSSEDD